MPRKVNLTTKVLMVVALAVLATTGAMWLAASKQIWSKLEAQQREKSDQYMRSLALVFSERFPGAQAKVVGGHVVNIQSPPLSIYNDFSTVDASVSYVGGSATIFSYDQSQDKFFRRVTTVKKENGERAVGTELASTSPAQAFVRRGEAYQGPVTLFGKRFETVYQPTFDATGKVNGILYVGVPVEDFYNAYNDTMWTMSLAAALIAILSCGAAAWAAARLFQPLKALSTRIEKLTQGDLEGPIAFQERGDEIGVMARALMVFRDALRAQRASAEAGVAEIEAKERRARFLDQTAMSFEAQVSGLTRALSTAALQMEATAQAMTATAEQTQYQSSVMAGAAEETSANVQTVAAATEELAASVQEIAAQVTHSSQIAGRAVLDAQRTTDIVQALASSAERIDAVVSLINSIAGQTNLLALNATIEAARAGEAGRGFAVVATEVKALASQTAHATGEIALQIGQVQAATLEAVGAIATISRTISEMSGISAAIAAAIEEQGAATREIARNVQEAASGTEHVTGNIGQVQHGAGQTGVAATQVLGAARELARHSENLTQEVGTFLATVKAA